MNTDLKVLMLSSDRNIGVPGSAVAERMKEYGNLVGELHIVILSDSSHGLKEMQLSNNVWIYSTNSAMSILRPVDAAKLGKKLIFEKKFVRGKSIITADSIECGWAGVKIKNKWRIPLEVQIHTDIFSPYFSGFKNNVRKYFAKSVLEKSDTVRVVSDAIKDQLSPYTKADIYVLPIYINREVLENMQPKFDIHTRYPWRFIMLMVSRLSPEKNIALALHTLLLVRQKFPDTGLVIVGSGSEESVLKNLVKKLQLDGSVEFTGWQEDVATFYKTANLFVQTSRFEGYGLSLVEAGFAGLPVVTTNVGIAVELENGKDAYIYDVNSNPEDLATGIIDILENNFKRENLKINLKRTLQDKLINKKEYLEKLAAEWNKTSLSVR